MTPFSVVRSSKELLFISGQLPVDEEENICDGGAYDQTILCLKNLDRVLKGNKLNKDNLVKTTVFTSDLTRLEDINKAFIDFFGDIYPTRSLFEVSGIIGDAIVEIDGIATF